jgi:hypothetical protein
LRLLAQIAELTRHEPAKRDSQHWQEALTQAVDPSRA